MKITKKIAVFFTVILMMIFCTTNIYAAGTEYIFDFDDSISASDEELLGEKLEEQKSKMGINIAIVVANDKNGKTSVSYADDMYEELFGINTNGILLLIDNEGQYDWISTSGSAINTYDDAYIDKIFDKITPKLKNRDFYGAANAFLTMLDTSYVKYENFIKFFIIGLGAFGIISIIVCLCISHSYKSNVKISAREYTTSNDTVFKVKNDKFLRQYTNKTKVSSDSGGRSGGSSTHHSSSGGTHGGGGRHR